MIARAQLVTLGILLALSSASLEAQPAFSTTVETVSLNVTVTTDRQGYVGNLTREDFAIFEDGVPQDVAVFASSDRPLDVVVLLDLSASLRSRLGLIRSAAKGFLATLRPADRGAVIGFNERVRLLAPWTSDPGELVRAVDQTRAAGGTSLYSAIEIALRGLGGSGRADEALRRRAIVVLSDGEDTSSLVTYDDVLDSCRRSGMSIFTIRLERQRSPALTRTLLSHRPDRDGAYVLNRLARESGARAFTASRPEQLGQIYAQIAEELSHQYLMGYVPAPQHPRPFHVIAVKVNGRPDLEARTRLGYIPAPARHGSVAAAGRQP